MLKLEILTPSGIIHDRQIYEVIIPTQAGEIGVMGGHEHLVTLTQEGAIAVRQSPEDTDDRLEYIAISREGVVEVTSDAVTILADDAIRSEDINEQEAKKAYETAQLLVKEAKDKHSLDLAMANLDRYAVRLRVADLRRRRRD